MENEHLLDINTDNIPLTSSPKDQSPASFSRDLIGRLGISSQGTETVIPETQRYFKICFRNRFNLIQLIPVQMLLVSVKYKLSAYKQFFQLICLCKPLIK